MRDPAAVDQRGAVGDAAAGRAGGQALGKSDDDRGARRRQRRRQRRERRRRGVEEAGPLEEIARRVAGHRQLRKDRQLRALPFGGRGRVQHQPAVALEIADGRVDLSERDLHERHSTHKPRPRADRQGRDARDKI